MGRVVHDDRGAASVEWVDAPAELVDRPTLSVEDARPAPRPGDGYNPYDREPGARPSAPAGERKPPAKRDLRKLSEWIKQMREMEERRRRGEPDEGD